MPKRLQDSFSVKYDYGGARAGWVGWGRVGWGRLKNGCVSGWELKALSLNPNTQPKVFFLLPDTGEINPPRKNRAGRLSRRRQSSPLFIVCENRSRGSALGWFEETRGEGGVVWWVGGGRGGEGAASQSLHRKGNEGRNGGRFVAPALAKTSVQRIQPGGGSDRTGVGERLCGGGGGWWIGSGEIVAERFF